VYGLGTLLPVLSQVLAGILQALIVRIFFNSGARTADTMHEKVRNRQAFRDMRVVQDDKWKSARGKPMRQTRCLRKTITCGATKNIMNRGFETEAMADRNKNRFHVNARAQHHAYHFVIVQEWPPCALLIRNLAMCTDQARFGDSDAGRVRQQSEMAGDTKPSRMRQTLTVT